MPGIADRMVTVGPPRPWPLGPTVMVIPVTGSVSRDCPACIAASDAGSHQYGPVPPAAPVATVDEPSDGLVIVASYSAHVSPASVKRTRPSTGTITGA